MPGLRRLGTGRLRQRGREALADLAGAWIFYSVLPAWPAPAPRFQRIARFAPWIGLILGALQAGLWWLLQGHLPAAALVALVLAAALLLSGGLHLDGAMDTADGLAAGPRALEAMRDSRVGAAGVQALALLLLLRGAGLLSLAEAVSAGGSGAIAGVVSGAVISGAAAPAPWAVPLALVWAAFWGRLSPLLALQWFPYLQPEGSAAFHRRHWRGLGRELVPAGLAFALLLLGSRAWPGTTGWLPLVGIGPALAVPLWIGRRLGGHSGDTYGACVEWSEALSLLAMGLLASLLLR